MQYINKLFDKYCNPKNTRSLFPGFYKDIPWSTKYTAVYITFEDQKLRGQISENLVLQIYEFLFNSDGEISKEKRITESSENQK